jgi:L-Ala-D/L-Glu epimerase
MTIKSIRVTKKNLALTRPYTIAFKTISDVEALLLEIELSNGIIGLGSANPSKEVVGEDVHDAFENLQSVGIQRFVGRKIGDMNAILSEVATLFPHKPGTLAAMDIALHDALCQYLGVSVAQFYGQKIKKLPTSVTIGIKNVADTLAEAEEYLGLGFKVLKVKTGLDVVEDAERILKLRERFGNKITIRVDANQGYTAAQTLEFVKNTEGGKIELIEQPLAAGLEKETRKLPKKIRKKLAADESLHDAQAAFQLAATQTFGIFNIKLMKCGGIAGARAISHIAEANGTQLFWGCNDESIISITAALHAAFASPMTRYLDLDGSLDLSEDFVKSGFILKNGMMSLPEKAVGLGLVR